MFSVTDNSLTSDYHRHREVSNALVLVGSDKQPMDNSDNTEGIYLDSAWIPSYLAPDVGSQSLTKKK